MAKAAINKSKKDPYRILRRHICHASRAFDSLTKNQKRVLDTEFWFSFNDNMDITMPVRFTTLSLFFLHGAIKTASQPPDQPTNRVDKRETEGK